MQSELCTALRRLEGNTKLMNAIIDKDYTEARRLIREGVDVNERSRMGSTPLICAAGRGNLPIVKLLVSKEAEIDAMVPEEGATAISTAAACGHLHIVKYLVYKEATIHHVTPMWKTTILMEAAMAGQLQVVEYLLSLGVDLYAIDYDGRSAVMLAALYGQHNIVEYLVEQGALDEMSEDLKFSWKDLHEYPEYSASPDVFNSVMYLIERGMEFDEHVPCVLVTHGRLDLANRIRRKRGRGICPLHKHLIYDMMESVLGKRKR